MRYISLGSGSKGNATLIEDAEAGVLIDCGFSRKGILDRLARAKFDSTRLAALLVTHEHADHSKGALALCELLDVPLYCSHGTAVQMGWVGHSLVRLVHNDELIRISGMRICPVTVPHDAREPLQYVTESREGARLGVLSDLGSITPHVLERYGQCHGLQLEANYDPIMLRNGPYPVSLQRRVGGDYGHLSNQQCAELLGRLMWSGLQEVSVGHISEKNNDERHVSLALSAILGCNPEDVAILGQNTLSGWRELSN